MPSSIRWSHGKDAAPDRLVSLSSVTTHVLRCLHKTATWLLKDGAPAGDGAWNPDYCEDSFCHQRIAPEGKRYSPPKPFELLHQTTAIAANLLERIVTSDGPSLSKWERSGLLRSLWVCLKREA